MQSDEEHELRRSAGEEPPRLADGQIDYDLGCARQIVTLSHALLGTEGLEGIVTLVSQESDLSELDETAMNAFRWLAEAIERQWGMKGLWRREASATCPVTCGSG